MSLAALARRVEEVDARFIILKFGPSMSDRSTVERAFTLAREGSCASVRELRDQLRGERYEGVDAHISGVLSRQLKAEIVKRLAKISQAKPCLYAST